MMQHPWQAAIEDEWLPPQLRLCFGGPPSSDSNDGGGAPPSSDGNFSFDGGGWGDVGGSNFGTDTSSSNFGTDTSSSNDGGGFQSSGGGFQSSSSQSSDGGGGGGYFSGYDSGGTLTGGDYQGGYNFSGDLNSGNIGLDSLSGQAFNSGAYSGGAGWAGGGPFGSGGSNYTYGTSADQNTGGGPFGSATGRDSGGPFGGWTSGFGGPPSDVAGQLSGNLTAGSGLIAGTNIADQGQPETPDALNGPQFDVGPPNSGQMPQGQGDGLPGWQISADPNQAQTYGPPSITGQDLQDLAIAIVASRQGADPYAMDPAAISAFEQGSQGRGNPLAGQGGVFGTGQYTRSGMDMEFNPFGNYQAPTQENQGTQGFPGRSDAPSLMDMIGVNQARAADNMPNVSQSWGGQTRAEAAQNGFLPQVANELNTQTLDAMRPDAGDIRSAFQAALNSGRPGWDPAEQLAGRSVIDLPAQPFDAGRSDTFASRFGENNQAVPIAQSPYAQSQYAQSPNDNFNSRFGDQQGIPGWLNPSDLTAGRAGTVDPSEWAQAQNQYAAPPVANMPWGSQPAYLNTDLNAAPSWMSNVTQALPDAMFLQGRNENVGPPITTEDMQQGRDALQKAYDDQAARQDILEGRTSVQAKTQADPFQITDQDRAAGREQLARDMQHQQALQAFRDALDARQGQMPTRAETQRSIEDAMRSPAEVQAPARGSPDRGATQQERGVNPQDRGDIRQTETRTPSVPTRDTPSRDVPSRQEGRAPLSVTVPGRTSSAPFGTQQTSSRGVQAQMDGLLNAARTANTLAARVQALDQLNGLISQYGNPYVGRGVTDPDINVRGGGPVYGTGIFRR